MTGTAVVFDFGAVLFRWRPRLLLARCLPTRVTDEASATHWMREVFQDYGGDWGEFDRGHLGPDALVARISARTGLAPAEVRAVVDAVPDELAPIPESVALLESLHARGVPLHYLSNMPGPYADHLERSHPFLHCFASGVFSSRVGLVKPDPAIFALAQARFGRPAADLVFLDDHTVNVDAARAAGWRAIHFTDAAAVTPQLEALLG